MTTPQTVLRDDCAHTTFRPGQKKIADTLLSGRDALCVMPTGAGIAKE